MCFSPSTLKGTVKEGLVDEGWMRMDIRLGGAVVVGLGGLGGLI